MRKRRYHKWVRFFKRRTTETTIYAMQRRLHAVTYPRWGTVKFCDFAPTTGWLMYNLRERLEM